MEKKIQNEELQSRREFFKKAAKATLPVVAAIALVGSPIIANADEVKTGCDNSCSTSCKGDCKGSCQTNCATDGCGSTCSGKCRGKCDSLCQDSCAKSSR